MATHSSVLAWRIPRTGEPGGLLSMGSHGVRHDWSDLAAAPLFLARLSTFEAPQGAVPHSETREENSLLQGKLILPPLCNLQVFLLYGLKRAQSQKACLNMPDSHECSYLEGCSYTHCPIFFFLNFIYFWCAGSLPGGHFFLVMKNRGYSLVAVSRFLTVVASLVEDRI